MNLQRLVVLVEKLLSVDFDAAEVVALVGSQTSGDDPNALIIKPHDPNGDYAQLILKDEGGVKQPAFLSLKYTKPVNIEARALAELYGAPHEDVRVKPTQPIPYTYSVARYAFPGLLTIGYAPEDAEMKQVLSVRILRQPR